MAQDNDVLKPKQTAAIAAMLDPANGSTVAAAKAAGVPLRTMNRWLGDPLFVAQLRKAEGDAIDESARRLISVSAIADNVIVKIMTSRDAPYAVRLRAAGMAKESMVRLRELRNVEDRLSALEAAYVNRTND